MIVVKIEMWPGGNESRAVEFSRAYITNDVKTTVESCGRRGSYSVELRGGVWGRSDLINRVWRRGTVTGFDRVKRGIWDLLFLSLAATVGKRNPSVDINAVVERINES